MSISFICYIKSNSTYQTVEKLTKKGNTIAFMLEQDDGSYKNAEELPTGYEFNQEKSQCNNGATPTWDKETKSLRLSITKKNTSCFLYFDRGKSSKKLEELGLTISKEGCPVVDDQGIATVTDIEGTNKLICSSTDNDGATYYYRGAVDNNWVKFAGHYWRIIRINGNGTVRLIYSGDTSAEETDTGTAINNGTYVVFNTKDDDNKYVGFMYVGATGVASSSYEGAHKVDSSSTKSTILQTIETWYTGTSGIAEQYRDELDDETGFCGDRELVVGYSSYPGAGYGKQASAYGPAHRVLTLTGTGYDGTQEPTFNCKQKEQDLYTTIGSEGGNKALTYPVGLITMDEVMFAGGYAGKDNEGYWLYTNQYYWTMSPYSFNINDGYARVFNVTDSGSFGYNYVHYPRGIRPVINLKANAKLITNQKDKKGTIDNPYIVEGAE